MEKDTKTNNWLTCGPNMYCLHLGSEKKETSYFYSYLHKMLTDVKNSVTRNTVL